MVIGRFGWGPGLRAPAAMLLALATPPAAAQQQRAPVPPARTGPAQAAPAAGVQPGVDPGLALRLLWSTLIAIDEANRTGEYSVLRDLGSASFQAGNNPTSLAAAFTQIRNQQIDLTTTLLVSPSWQIAPVMTAPGTLRMRGVFPLRPVAIAFDLIYMWDHGWRLNAVAVQGVPAAPPGAGR